MSILSTAGTAADSADIDRSPTHTVAPDSSYESTATPDNFAKPVHLIITSVPRGARLFINNRNAGTTPFEDKKLQPGQVTLRVKKEGYKDFERTLSFHPGDGKRITVRLQEDKPLLTVLSTPDSAGVFVDNIPLGTTPFEGRGMSPGIYSLSVKKRGYVTVDRNVTLVEGRFDTVTVELLSQAFQDSLTELRKRRLFIGRNVVLGTVTALLGIVSITRIMDVHEALDNEENLQAAYTTLQPTEQPVPQHTYDQAWEQLSRQKRGNDSLLRSRNRFLTATGLFGAGLTISLSLHL